MIIVVNQFRYTNNNFTTDGCSIPIDMTAVLSPHKISLQAPTDHHGPSMYSGHYTTSINCCQNILLQRHQDYGDWNCWYKKLLYCSCGNVWIDYIMVFGLEQEDGSFNYSHGTDQYIISIPLEAGRGISARTCGGLDDALPLDGLGSVPYTPLYIYIC